jgi:hypothetical protein
MNNGCVLVCQHCLYYTAVFFKSLVLNLVAGFAGLQFHVLNSRDKAGLAVYKMIAMVYSMLWLTGHRPFGGIPWHRYHPAFFFDFSYELTNLPLMIKKENREN